MSRVGPKVVATPPTRTEVARTVDPSDPFRNGKADALPLKDAELKSTLTALHRDAETFSKALPGLDPKVVVVGTARSAAGKLANGHIDFRFLTKLGAELAKAGFSVGSGGGGGAMLAPLLGHARYLAHRAKHRLGWEEHAPQRQGGNIKLTHEQRPNTFIDKGRLATFERFLFRMEFLFRNTRDFIVAPGGYGTVAEVFSFLAMKAHGHVGDPVLFGAPDDYFDKHNRAFAALLEPHETADLKNIFHSPRKLVHAMVKAGTDGVTDDVPALAAAMQDDLEKGLSALDGKPAAITFVGGKGARTQAAAATAAAIAAGLSQDEQTLRVVGSEVLDPKVRAAGKDVQAFALSDSKVEGDSTKVDHVLVLRELADTNVKGLVVVPDGLDAIALLFTTATDIQTGKMPRIPIVVLDPDGKFEELKATLKHLMLSKGRQYIDPSDLDIFSVTNDPNDALRILQGGSS